MKRIYTILVAVMLMPVWLSAENPSYEITGQWYDTYSSESIKVKHTRRGVKVKGISRRNKWVAFDYNRRRGYRDCNGNTLRINRYGELVYEKKRTGQRLVFDRTRRALNSCQPSNPYREGYRNEWSTPSYRHRYYVREINEDIYLQRNGNRLRAKRQGADWVYYEQNRYRKNEFVDDRGNRYFLKPDGSYRWVRWDQSVSLNLRPETISYRY